MDRKTRTENPRVGGSTPPLATNPPIEHEMHTETRCTIVFMRYPGPTTGVRPICQGRFDGRDAAGGTAPDLEHCHRAAALVARGT